MVAFELMAVQERLVISFYFRRRRVVTFQFERRCLVLSRFMPV